MLPVLALAAFLVAGAGLSCGDDTESGPTSTAGDLLTAPPASRENRSVGLPAPRKEGPVSLEEAVQSRRSIREFSGEPLTLEEVGQLLWAAQGITSAQGARAAPSAGGTYPLELYLAAGDIAGLEPGVYHYRPAGHGLVAVSAGDVRARLVEASLDQAWVGEAAADFIIAAVYERTKERYGERGVRYVHLEAGHAAQNLCLQATALGLGAVTVGAFTDEDVWAVLGMAEEETPLYVIPVGRRR